MSSQLVAAEAISIEYGSRTVLRQISLRVHGGDRVALVGANGAGKSTLLRLLAGVEPPGSGTVGSRPGLRAAYLPQVVGTGERTPLRQAILDRVGVGAATRRLEAAEAALSDGALEAVEAHAEALERWMALGGGDAEARLPEAARDAGLDPALLDRPLSSLSGGQAARAGLAALGLARLDLALIDEPSNHLDRDGIERLESILAGAGFAYVLASHDRLLLERAADRVVVLDHGEATEYAGGWSAYLREREADRARAEAEYAEAAAERRRLIEMERRIRQQAVAGQARARRKDESDKFIRYANVQSAQRNTAASGIAKRIERLEVPDKPWRPPVAKLLLDAARPVHGRTVASVEGAVLARGGWRSSPLSLTVEPGERILLEGPNGSGKSSLIAVLAGRMCPAEGTVRIARGALIAELAQERDGLLGTAARAVDGFRAAVPSMSEQDARTTLATMGIGPDKAELPVGSLSAGERTRAELAAIARVGAACLLLDEPSNHLDVEALETLEEALESWAGALVVASHDRLLREAIRFDRTVSM